MTTGNVLLWNRRQFLALGGLGLMGLSLAPAQTPPEKKLPDRQPADALDGPPIVSARAWVIAEGQTGRVLWGSRESLQLTMASTTKIMTAHLVLQLAADDPKRLDEIHTVSETSARTGGSSARIRAGERYTVRDLLHGLLLPSGNDAAMALAEHFGPSYRPANADTAPVAAFVAQMNRRAETLQMPQTRYFDPHGNSSNHSSARDLAKLAATAMTDPLFRRLVGTRRYTCEATDAQGEKRPVTWDNTNQLLNIEGFDGVKTGTTTAAGACLVASGRRGADHLLVVVLGCSSTEGRYVDSRNLFRWAWRQRENR